MLMQIKARMLLPAEPIDEGEDLTDPRTELTRRLLEYKKFKESAEELQNLEFDQRQRFFRRYFREDVLLIPCGSVSQNYMRKDTKTM